MKVISLIGTRPEIIKLSRILNKLDEFFQHIMVHTGQNYDYELNQIFFKDLSIREPNFFLNSQDTSACKTIANIIYKFDEILENEKPDALLVLGDTNSTLAVICAKKRKIPIFHMEAGNRCFDQRVPEEINRKIIDHISDINLPYSQIAKYNLLNEGLPIDRIIVTGSPMLEVINYYKNKIDTSTILSELKLITKKYFIVSFHREENVDNVNNFEEIITSIQAIYQTYKIPIIISTHPRVRKHIQKIKTKLNNEIIFAKPFSLSDYINLQKNALCVISDSGTLTEESSILNLCSVNLRNTHERQEGMENMVSILTGLNKSDILQSIKIAISLNQQRKKEAIYVDDYQVDDVSSKIVGIIQSYTHYVNDKVWRK